MSTNCTRTGGDGPSTTSTSTRVVLRAASNSGNAPASARPNCRCMPKLYDPAPELALGRCAARARTRPGARRSPSTPRRAHGALGDGSQVRRRSRRRKRISPRDAPRCTRTGRLRVVPAAGGQAGSNGRILTRRCRRQTSVSQGGTNPPAALHKRCRRSGRQEERGVRRRPLDHRSPLLPRPLPREPRQTEQR